MIFRMILNLPGNSAMIGLVFKATGLYFFPVVRLCDFGVMCDVLSLIGSAEMSVEAKIVLVKTGAVLFGCLSE